MAIDFRVAMRVPLKQGLKHFNGLFDPAVDVVAMRVPLKQGLKPVKLAAQADGFARLR